GSGPRSCRSPKARRGPVVGCPAVPTTSRVETPIRLCGSPTARVPRAACPPVPYPGYVVVVGPRRRASSTRPTPVGGLSSVGRVEALRGPTPATDLSVPSARADKPPVAPRDRSHPFPTYLLAAPSPAAAAASSAGGRYRRPGRAFHSSTIPS